MAKSYKLKGDKFIDSSGITHGQETLKNYLEQNLKFTPIFDHLITDSETISVAIDSTLEGMLLWINTHINIREIYIITYYGTIGMNVDSILKVNDENYTHFSINKNVLTIKAAGNCRGQLYRVWQILEN